MSVYFAERALLPSGWAEQVRIEVGADGVLTSIQANASSDGAQLLAGSLLPGMPNLHSHAFQRAMAGLAEVAGNPNDSFWTWRE
ncbi:MAG TPA: formimidoylglutamate deiminase, partial [Pseudomonas sp.]|nr:formimidoylglutamate deiminase [Pseudomonas sp.]